MCTKRKWWLKPCDNTFKMFSCLVNSSNSFPPSSEPVSCLFISATWSESRRISTIIWDDDFGEPALVLDWKTVYVVLVIWFSLALGSRVMAGYWMAETWELMSFHLCRRRVTSGSMMTPAPLSVSDWPCCRTESKSLCLLLSSSSKAWNEEKTWAVSQENLSSGFVIR